MKKSDTKFNHMKQTDQPYRDSSINSSNNDDQFLQENIFGESNFAFANNASSEEMADSNHPFSIKNEDISIHDQQKTNRVTANFGG